MKIRPRKGRLFWKAYMFGTTGLHQGVYETINNGEIDQLDDLDVYAIRKMIESQSRLKISQLIYYGRIIENDDPLKYLKKQKAV